MRVGSELKTARKKAGLTIEAISKRTKVQVSKLAALEKNDFKNLPTGLYLFSVVRAYAREVQIDPEPIVERLRAEFADKDTLDALQALDKAGALGKNCASPRRSGDEQSKLLRNAAIAAGVVMMAAAGARAGVYLHHARLMAPELRSATAERPSGESASPFTSANDATAVDVPQAAAPAAQRPGPAKTPAPKARAAIVTSRSSSAMQIDPSSTPRRDELVEPPANVEQPASEAPGPATVP